VSASARRGAWAALAVALIWGVNVPVMKAAIATLHPFTFNALRLSCSVVVLALAELAARREARVPTPWGTVVFLALLTSVAYQALFIGGMARTSAGHTGFIVASGPLWTALAGRVMGVERVGARAWVGLGLAFLGTALVVTTAGGREATPLGNLLVVAAMVVWAVGTVHSRGVLQTFPAGRLAFLTSLVALPGHWLIAWPHLGELAAEQLDGAMWASIVYSGALSTGLAYVLWNASVRSVGPARTSAYTNLVPLVALAVAWAWLGERPTLDQLAGGALILIGIASWRTRR